jgi:Ca2+-transporting ATPase
MRAGELMTIDAADLVVGDIVTLELGKSVPADCVVIDSADLSCNESAMTGEPDARKKVAITAENYNDEPCPFVLKSSLIETGNGKAIVIAVGPLTFIGKTEALLSGGDEQTPL